VGQDLDLVAPAGDPEVVADITAAVDAAQVVIGKSLHH
jgi:hypothetical protein